MKHIFLKILAKKNKKTYNRTYWFYIKCLILKTCVLKGGML